MPGVDHEYRRQELDTMLLLAGLTSRFRLRASMQPDVARFDPRSPRVAIADAKGTETPGNAETRRRLLAYARACVPWANAGWAVSLSIGADTHHGAGWRQALQSVWAIAGFQEWRTSDMSLASGTLVVTIESLSAGGLDEGRGPLVRLTHARFPRPTPSRYRPLLRSGWSEPRVP